MLTTTAREFRPDVPTSSHATEDLQPNEAINKRQRVAPPAILPASVKPPLFKNLSQARRRHNNGGATGIEQQGADSSHGNWTQHALRGNKYWRGNLGVRGGGHSRGASNRAAWRHPSHSHPPSRPPGSSTPFSVTAEPPMLRQLQSNTTSKPLAIMYPLPPKPSGISSPVPKHTKIDDHARGFNTAYQPVLNKHQDTGEPTVTPRQPSKLNPISPLPQRPPETPASSSVLKHSASPPMILGRSSTPPSKRRKLDHTPVVKVEEIEPLASSTHLQSHPYVTLEVAKVEKRSPSPLPRRLVTESCSFYPLPEDCRKSNSNHRQNRQAFFAQEYNVLKCLGLKRTKVIFRDDGMVIEWTSNTPVWSDTLRPEPSNLSSVIGDALQANSNKPFGKRNSMTPRRSSSYSAESNNVVVGDSTSFRQATCSIEPVSPPQSGQHKSLPSQLSPPLPRRRTLPTHKLRIPQITPNVENAQVTLFTAMATMKDHPELQPELVQFMNKDNDRAISTSTSANINDTPNNASRTRAWSAEELEKVEPMAVDYLQRYIRTFDSDRSALEDAYTDDALFSYRMSLISPSSSTTQSSSFISYRLPQVISSLSSILPSYKFCLRDGAGEIHYDVVSLDGQAGGGVLVTLHGALSRADANVALAGKSEYDHVVAVDQSFVLHQKGADDDRKEVEDTGGTEGKVTQSRWPLVAASHQMVVRDIDVRSGRIKFPLPIASTSSLSDHFPWLA